MIGTPSSNGANGLREGNGRFATGNPGGPGNPFARRVAALRSAMLTAVTENDVQEIVAALVQQAKAGDVVAAREILNRLIGKPSDTVDPDRVELDEMQLESDLDTASICRAMRLG